MIFVEWRRAGGGYAVSNLDAAASGQREGMFAMQKLRVVGMWLVLGMVSLAAACDNTIRGVGQDIEDTGDAIEDSAS